MYNLSMAFIISADDIKKTLLGYVPEKSEFFHRESAKLADVQFAAALKDRPEKTVVLMAGGTASGKTEYVSAYLQKRRVIIFDGTLPEHIQIFRSKYTLATLIMLVVIRACHFCTLLLTTGVSSLNS